MGTRPQTPLPFLVDGEEAYRVHELLDSRRRCSTLQYLVDWEGFGPEERSLVNAGDILDPTLTEEFHRTLSEKPAPRPRGRPRRRLLPRAMSRSQGGGLCYRGGSCTASLAPPEGAIPWILTISIWTPVPIIPHTWDWLIIHTCSSLTHTYKPHTHTDSLQSLDLPRLSFLSVIAMFDFCVLDLGPLPIILIVFCLPRPRIVSPELCLLATCPDPLPGTRPCLCLSPAVLPCRYLTLYCLTILIKSCKWIQTLLTHHHTYYATVF